LHSRIGGRKKPDQGDEEQTGVQPFRAVSLNKAVKVAVKAALADLGMNLIGDLRATASPTWREPPARMQRDRRRPKP
jgi:hypothetical protein